MHHLKSFVSICGLIAIFSAGCGGAAMPVDKLTDAKATMRAAQEAGADSNPQAALHLKMANDELASAQAAINDKDSARAQLLLNQAQSDADLSLAQARGATDIRAAQDAQAKINTLQKQPQ